MKKNTRININTSFKIYVKVFVSFIFNRGKKNKEKLRILLQNFFSKNNLLLTSQGRVAAYNIFKVILSDKKNEILVCPYTLTEIVNAIIYAGGKPVYVEIDLKTGLPLEDDLDNKINYKTAGLIITHLYSNKEDLLKFAKKYNQRIKIIEDAAINFGAKIEKDKFIGTLFDYGFYSFGIMKQLCTFHGGAIYSKDRFKLIEIEKNLDQNVNYPMMKSLKLFFFCILIDFFYNRFVFNFFTYYILKLPIRKLEKLMNPNVYPQFFENTPDHYNYKFQSNFAVAGIENLKTLKNKIHNKIEKVKLYEKNLDKKLIINNFSFYEVNSFLEYPILLKKNNSKFLSKELLKIGYDIRHTWYVNSSRYLSNNCEFNDFSNCENLHEKVLSLPTHDKILEEDIIKISKLINFFEK